MAELVEVRKTYRMGHNEVHALKSVSFAIEEGEFWSIMGPSGSGKSTLLNLLGCLDRPSAGDYILGGKNVAKMNDRELSSVRGEMLGFVFQSFNLIQQLDVIENIEVPLFYQGIPPRQAREKAMQLAERVGLGDRADHRPFQLSGGQQQRVAIARALVNDPILLLADEPTGNLDTRTGVEIMNMLHELHAQGSTIVMVTHEDEVANNAQHILTVRDGLVQSIRDGIGIAANEGLV
ncbi:MAG: ABC transporter ATP-binding protein [Planctomycetes bacterium]|nr:ABC transporter ATP-binding protein [Planctomycetota bacterium]